MKADFKNCITLGMCTLECLIFGGPLFGWPFLAYVYKDLGFFCDSNVTLQSVNGTELCADQDLYLPLASNVGFMAFSLGALPIGWLFDRFGLRVVRSIALIAGVGGTLALAFAMNMNPFLIYLGTFLTIAAAGIISFTSHHVAILAGVRAPIFNMVNSSVLRASGIVIFLVKVAYDHGFSPRLSLIVLACLWTLMVLTTFVLLPPYKVDYGEGDKAQKARAIRHPLSSKRSVRGFMANSPNTLKFLTRTAVPADNADTENKPSPEHHPNETEQSVWYYLKSFPYIMHLLYFNVIFLWQGFMFGILNTWLSVVFNRDQELVSSATNVYAYIQSSIAILSIPLPLALIGWVRSYAIRTGNIPENAPAAIRVVVTVPALLLTSLCYMLVAFCMLLPPPVSPYLVFVFLELGKTFNPMGATAVIFIMFPMEHFAVLFGLIVTVSATGLPIQYGFLRWYAGSGHTPTTWVMLVTLALTLIHPIIITINYLRGKRRLTAERKIPGTDDDTEQATPLAKPH